MEHPLAGSTIAKKRKRYIVVTVVLIGKCNTCTCANLCTHNTMTAKETNIGTKKVHTSTFTF